MKNIPIISFGEIVWDKYENDAVLAGAPLNVAYHLHAQGWSTGMISRVGEDELGRKAIDRIEGLGIPVSGIQKDADLETGLVLVSFDANQEPSYEIVQPTAWDNILVSEVPADILESQFHLVYGTLAQRNSVSRHTLQTLLQKAQTRFYDVNLRPPHCAKEHVKDSLHAANVVKMTREELHQLNDWFLHSSGDEDTMGRLILHEFDIEVLAVTDGARGASLFDKETVLHHPGFPVNSADPVGSGDAFFSALIIGYLTNVALEECLVQANRLGAFVASQSGATPEYPQDLKSIGID